MSFAPEDLRAWKNSEVMIELEKVAKDALLLEGGPPEALQPIPEGQASLENEERVWEEEGDADKAADDPLPEEMGAFAVKEAELVMVIRSMARKFADAGQTKVVYRLERTLAELDEVILGG